MCQFLQFAVTQRHLETGCIPTGYEFLLRASNVQSIEFSTFQEDFDLSIGNRGENNFDSISDAVQQRYSHVNIARESNFADGHAKVNRIVELYNIQKPCLISLYNPQVNRYHIMPIVDYRNGIFCLLNYLRPDGTPDIMTISESEIIFRHDNYPGGNDIAYLN